MAYDPQTPLFNTPNRVPTLNPLDAELAKNSQADDLWESVRRDIGTLAGTFDKLSTLANGLFADITAINGNTRLSIAAKAEDDTQRRNTYLNGVDGLQQQAQQARQRVLDIVNGQLNDSGFMRGTTSQDTLVFSDRVRDSWTRLQWVLDAVDDHAMLLTKLTDLAKMAGERNDSFMISAIRQNAEMYLLAKGIKMADLTQQLMQAFGPSISPKMRAAFQIQQALEAGYRNLVNAFQVAQGFGNDRNPFRVNGLPGWMPGQTVNF